MIVLAPVSFVTRQALIPQRLTMAVRVGRTWSLFRPCDIYPLLVAAIAGWVVMRRRRRRSWPLLVPVVIVTIASGVTYGQTRFRVPAEPSLVVLAAVAVAALVSRDWPARRRAQPV